MAKKYAWEDESLSEEVTIPVAPAQKSYAFEDEALSEPVETLGPYPVTRAQEQPLQTTEVMARLPRAGVQAFTLGASEVVAPHIVALGQTVTDLIGKNEFKGAKDLVDHYWAVYSSDVQKQKQLEREYPWLTGFAKGAGYAMPQGLGAKIGEAALVGAKGLAQTGIGLAKAGAQTAALEKTAELIKEQPVEPKTLPEMALGVGESAVVGGVAAPVVAGGIAGTVAVAQKVGAELGPLAKRIGASEPMLRLVQVFTRVPVKVQREYLAKQKMVDELPSNETIQSAFNSLIKQINEDESITLDQLNQAEKNVAEMESALKSSLAKAEKAEESKILNTQDQLNNLKANLREKINQLEKGEETLLSQESKAVESTTIAQRDELKRTDEALKEIRTDLTTKRDQAKRDLDQNALQLKETAKPADTSIVAQNINQSLVNLKEVIGDESARARSLINPDFSLKTSQVIGLIDSQLSQLAKVGKEGQKVYVGTQAKQAERILEQWKSDLSELPEQIPGTLVKDLIQQLDGDISGYKNIDFADAGERSLISIRKQLDSLLKNQNEEYKQAMIPVYELMALREKAIGTFGGTKAQSGLKKATKEVVARTILEDLEKATGMNLLEGVTMLEEAALGKRKSVMSEQLQGTEAFKEYEKNKKLLDFALNGDLKDPFIQENLDDPVVQKIVELRAKQKQLTDKPSLMAERKEAAAAVRGDRPGSEQVANQIREMKTLIELASGKQFAQSAIQNISDKAAAAQIIETYGMLQYLKDENVFNAAIAERVRNQQMSLEEAKMLRDMVKARAEQFVERTRKIAGKQTGAHVVATILRNPNGISETLEATRVIDAVSQLPEAEFAAFFKDLNISNPEEFKTLANLLRLKANMGLSRGMGSRSVNMGIALASSMGDVDKSGTMSKLLQKLGGPVIGGMLDDFGGAMTKAYLRNLNELEAGIPTLQRFESASVLPFTTGIKNAFSDQLMTMANDINDKQSFAVSDGMRQPVTKQIQNSKMNSIEKARALSSLSKTGMLEGKYIRSIMTEGLRPETKMDKPTSSNFFSSPSPSPSLEADKPKKLQDNRLEAPMQKVIEKLRGGQ